MNFDALERAHERAQGVSPRALSLRAVVALLLAFATLPVGVLAVAQGIKAYQETKVLRRAAIARDAIAASSLERGRILEAFGSLVALDSQLDLNAPLADCTAMMKAHVENDDNASFVGLVSPDGYMRCGSPLTEPLYVGGTPEFNAFYDEPRRTVTAYKLGKISKRPVLVVSAPVYRDEELVGSLAISLPSRYLKWVSELTEDGASSRYAIVGAQGLQVALKGKSEAVDWLPDTEAMKDLLTSSAPTVVMPPSRGNDRIYAVTPLYENDVFAISSWPAERLTSGASWQQYLAVVLPMMMWAMAVAVAYYAVDRFALRHVMYLDRLVTAYTRSRRRLRARGTRRAPYEFAMLGASFDAMAEEIEHREQALRDSLDDKNALLKEVYHRVKNNLQLIISLMNLQMRDASTEHERDGLMRLQDRVYGLAAVHQKLYEAESLNAVRVDLLIQDIALNAKGSRANNQCEVDLRFDMTEHTEGPDRALPIAMFATEAIANAFKHSLVHDACGWLQVILREDEGYMILEISNERDGQVPAEKERRVGLGSQLIDGFARQLHGELHKEMKAQFYKIRLRFPKDEAMGKPTAPKKSLS